MGNRYSVLQVKFPARLDGNHILSRHMRSTIYLPPNLMKRSCQVIVGNREERLRDSFRFLISVYQCSPVKEASICDCFVLKSVCAAPWIIQRSATQSCSARVTLQVQIANYLLGCSVCTTLQELPQCVRMQVWSTSTTAHHAVCPWHVAAAQVCVLCFSFPYGVTATLNLSAAVSQTHTQRHTPPVGWDEKRHLWYFPKDLFFLLFNNKILLIKHYINMFRAIKRGMTACDCRCDWTD